MEGQLLDLGFDSPPPAFQPQANPPPVQQQPSEPAAANFTNQPDPFSQLQQQPQQSNSGKNAAAASTESQPPTETAAATTNTSQTATSDDGATTPSSTTDPVPTPSATATESTDDAPSTNGSAADNDGFLTFVTGTQEVPTDNPAAVVTLATSPSSASTASSPPVDEKGKLKEIQTVFGGHWRVLRSDPYVEYLKATGVGLMTRNRVRSGKSDLQLITKDGYIYINQSSMLHTQVNKYKLDESLENDILGNMMSVFCSYQDQKLELQMTPVDVAWSRTQSMQLSKTEAGELAVIHTSGSHVCRRYYGYLNPQ